MNNNDIFKDKTVVTTGLEPRDEKYVRENVEAGGGTFKPSFVKSLDMLVFNPQYYKETVKMRSTKELIDQGHPVKMVTFTEFCKLINEGASLDDPDDPAARGFHIENEELVQYVEVTDCIEITVPGTVRAIGCEAFKYCRKTKRVVVPEGVERICDFAFARCESIEEIVLPEGLKEIGNAAFGDCHNLRSVNIPDSVEKMGPQVFAGCYKLERIRLPEAVEKIEWNMFIACEALVEIGIGSKVNKIEEKAFSGCKSLTNIILPESINEIPREAFSNCSSLKEISLPESVRAIERKAFEGCSSLESASHGKNLVQVKEEAFRGCSSLKNFVLPETLRTVCSGVFDGCSSLESVTIPDGVTRIEAKAFSGCKNLKKIVLPESVEVINASAFEEIPDAAFNQHGNGLYLEHHGNPYYWFVLPTNYDAKVCAVSTEAVKIAKDAFFGSGQIKEIIIPKNIENLQTSFGAGVNQIVIYDNLRNAQKALEGGGMDFYRELVVKSAETDEVLNVVPVHYEIVDIVRGAWQQGNQVKYARIDNYFNRTKSKSSKIKTSITRLMHPMDLDDKYREQYLAYLNTNSKAVVMQAIEDDDMDVLTFLGENGLIKKASVKAYIAEATKRNAVAITAYLLEYNNQPKESIPKPPKAAPKAAKKKEPSLKDWEFRNLGNSNIEITKYKGGKKTEVEVPESFHDQIITSIGADAFSGRRAKSCLSIEKIVIPDSVKRIGKNAFDHCEKLKELSLPSSLESIGENAFSACRKIKSFSIPESVKRIGQRAFAGCSGIKEFSFPSSIEEVPEHVLDGCVNLESVSLSPFTRKIGKNAFNGCKRLKAIDIPETVETIEFFAFSGCAELKEIRLPKQLKLVESLAFKGCESIKTICIPKDACLDNGTGSPFEGCKNLQAVTVDPDSSHYVSVDGVLFNKDMKAIVRYPNAKANTYSIPEGVEMIGRYSFSKCVDLQTVTIPGSVKTIEEGAFSGCEMLQHINMPQNLEMIGRHAFSLCSFTEIELPESLRVIGEYAFSSCILKSITIPEGVQELGYEAFFQNRSLGKVILPASLTKIGGSYFGSKVFDLCPNIRVYAPKGSVAEQYCIENGIELVESPDGF